MNLFHTFLANRQEHSSESAFLVTSGDRSVSISWGQFTDDIAVVAELIRADRPQGAVALLGENSYEWIVAHAACLFTGVTVVPIDVNLNPEQIAARLRKVRAAVLVHSSLYAEKARAAHNMCAGVLIASFGSVKTDLVMALARERLRFGKKSIWEDAPLERNEEAISMIVFTSGTTSMPRGVMITTQALESIIDYASERLDIRAGNRSLMILPLQHIFGMCVAYLLLSKRAAMGVCPDFRRLYDAVERFRADFLFLVPALAEILAKKISQKYVSAEAAFGSPLQWIAVGGAPLHRRVHDNLTILGVKVLGAYGLTETCSEYSLSNSSDVSLPGCAGLAARTGGVETKVSENGELLIKGPCVFKGYYEEPQETAKVMTEDGWFRTGDTGKIDEMGRVWVTGRISRTIVLDSGKKVSPEELEMRLMELPGIQECLVYEIDGTRTIVAEVYSQSSQKTVQRHIDELNKALPVYMRIRKVFTRDEPFPRTTSGKIKTGGKCREL